MVKIIDKSELGLIERLAIGGMELDMRLNRKTEIPSGAIKILEELSKKDAGFLMEQSRLSSGKYLHIRFNKARILEVDKDGNSKVINKFSLGIVQPVFRTEMYIKLSGDTKPGLIEAKQTKHDFQLEREDISLKAGLLKHFMENKKSIIEGILK